MNEVARCGDLWWLCGPVFNMASPMYWISTAVSASVTFWIGFRAGLNAAKNDGPA